jgi:hypothetical protein
VTAGRSPTAALRGLRGRARTALVSNAWPHLRTRLTEERLDDVAVWAGLRGHLHTSRVGTVTAVERFLAKRVCP